MYFSVIKNIDKNLFYEDQKIIVGNLIKELFPSVLSNIIGEYLPLNKFEMRPRIPTPYS